MAEPCSFTPIPTVLIEWCVQVPLTQPMDAAANVERWCKINRIGRCFAAKQGSLSFLRSVVEHHVRKPTTVQSGAGVLNSQRDLCAREMAQSLPCGFPDENEWAKKACEVRLAQGQTVSQVREEALRTIGPCVVSMMSSIKAMFGWKMDVQHGRSLLTVKG